jgi:hypothetical protein
MSKDLIIGGASNYTWDHLKYWVNSIKRSGFTGDIAIVGSNISATTKHKLESEGVKVFLFESVLNIEAPHVSRFRQMWLSMNTMPEWHMYRFVITTDTKDVIFQENPSAWLGSFEDPRLKKDLFFSSEELLYKHEPWGQNNIVQTFGTETAITMVDDPIFNVGVIAGRPNLVRDLIQDIYVHSINRPIPIVDQAVFNYLISREIYRPRSFFTKNVDYWAIQLGTTIHAIQAGAGDLGRICVAHPENIEKYKEYYLGEQPVFTDDGIVKRPHGVLFSVVHQYDRVPGLKEKIQKKYGDN